MISDVMLETENGGSYLGMHVSAVGCASLESTMMLHSLMVALFRSSW